MATVAPSRIRTGRAAEVWLFLLALALGIGGYALVGLNTGEALPENFGPYALTLVATAVVLHLVVRWRARHADPLLLPLALALNGIGLAMIHRIDIGLAARGQDAGFGPRQLIWTILGVTLAVLVIVVIRDHRILRRYTFTAMVAGIILLVLPMVPGLGSTINGARLWIQLGPYSFQPAELAKILLAIFFAGYLVTNRDVLTLAGPKVLGLQLPRLRDLGPLVVAWAACIGVLVVERDLGTSLLFFGLFVAMVYVATERASWIVIGLLMFAAGAVLAVSLFPHVADRFDIWLNALDPEIYNREFGGSGQVVRGLFGLALGGLMGTGWGEGFPHLVSYANSDFIVAALGEELGLTGLIAILMVYLVLAQRGIRMAIGVRDGFGKLLASGLAFTIAFQCFVVVGGVTRLIPLTGLTMPFMAAGGSSLVANWIVIGLLVRISDSSRRPAAEGRGEVVSADTAMIALSALSEEEPNDDGPRARNRSAPARVAGSAETDEDGRTEPLDRFGPDDQDDDPGTQHTEVVDRP
ncbi:FtsW/RodA/SpoVE family cell cycle protein [Ruania halotolerans]|uniref:FtsW/RodA/SpoVE family cell cycle protein n=1 Tax=Ruania halotolerans TaxID=2897773 RepID=UPI001E505A6B|nr:FtsW/RodA/SpoVE family cell cycle protein [Ruania halotolerans]UFU06641.1 FtsW/RodA/SpoVE family cell cycle protein [Ruania halotolerans]